MNNNYRRLAAWVIVDGQAYGPDHDLPADIAARITNPNAWPPNTNPAEAGDDRAAAEDDASATEDDPPTGEDVDQPPPQTPATDTDTDDMSPPVAGPPAPPRSGKGSGLDAWRAFAAAKRVDVPNDAERADIITACEKAGHVPPATP
ncbi:MAG TPA: hypothetical protein VF755_29105 [Catenuloplanes sp.]|jgi:hypothetical protein